MTIVDFGVVLGYRLKSTMAPKELNIFIKPSPHNQNFIHIHSFITKQTFSLTNSRYCLWSSRFRRSSSGQSSPSITSMIFSRRGSYTRSFHFLCNISRFLRSNTSWELTTFSRSCKHIKPGILSLHFCSTVQYIKDISSLEKNQDYIKVMSLGCKFA